MRTAELISKELETRSEPEVMQEMAGEVADALLETMNRFVEVNGQYRHPGVVISGALEALLTVVMDTTPEEDWVEVVEMMRRQVEMILEERKNPVPKNSDLEPDQLVEPGGDNG